MAPLMARLGPTAAVLAVVGYLCCPPAGVPDARGKAEDKIPTVTHGLLAAVAAPDPSRDPFGLKDAPPPPRKGKAPRPRAPAPAGGAAAGRPGLKAAGRGKAPVDLAALVRGLSLKAICAHEGGGTALIDGRLYSQGDTLPGAGKEAVGLLVARVYPDRVLLEHEGQTAELKFSDRGTRGARPRPRPRKSRPALRGGRPGTGPARSGGGADRRPLRG